MVETKATHTPTPCCTDTLGMPLHCNHINLDGNFLVIGVMTVGELYDSSSFSPAKGTTVPTPDQREVFGNTIVRAVNMFEAHEEVADAAAFLLEALPGEEQKKAVKRLQKALDKCPRPIALAEGK